MFDLIVNPLITLLALFYSVMGNNTVLAIAVLTVAIRLLTSPLMIQQQRSTKAMQEIQPKLKQIQEKYKNDREKLSQAQMALYKENGINPLGGCLPLIVQLPILLALYQSIILALAGTPYQLIDLSGRLLLPGLDNLVPLNNIWLEMDLTLPPTQNPTYALALPVLVMGTSWLQSKLTLPSAPKQDNGEDGEKSASDQAAAMTRSMTTIMPLMFGFFSLSFSVGLSIYFIVSNLVGIAQYTLMGRAEWGNLLGRPSKKAETKAIAEVTTSEATPDDTGVVVKDSEPKNEKNTVKPKVKAKPKPKRKAKAK